MNNKRVLIQNQFTELKEKHKGLTLTESNHGEWIIQGLLEFVAEHKDLGSIKEQFQIELTITENYPNVLPIAKETDGRIPENFHKNPDESFCLGAPLAVRKKFTENPSLLGFVDDQIIYYLYLYCYFEQHKIMPFGELSHGGKGLIEYYKQLFNVASGEMTMKFLRMVAEKNSYKGHYNCPCGSGKQIRNCHGGLIREISYYQDQVSRDYKACLKYYEDCLEDLKIQSRKNYQNLQLKKEAIYSVVKNLS